MYKKLRLDVTSVSHIVICNPDTLSVELLCISMGTVSARLPDDLEERLDEYAEEKGVEKSVAVRKLLSEGLREWKFERAVSLLEEGEVSFNRAVEMAETDVWSFSEYLEEKDVAWVEDAEDEIAW